MNAGGLAYVNARIRARRSRMLGRDDLLRLAATGAPSSALDGWRDLDADDGAAELLAFVYARLVAEYALGLRICPDAAPVLRALIQLHEAENVKLVWRALARDRVAEEWLPLWRPLGALETVTRDRCRTLPTIRTFVDALTATPFGGVAQIAYRAHAADAPAAEIAIDRWATSEVTRAADALDTRERDTRALLMAVAGERNAALAARAGRAPATRGDDSRRRKRVLSARIFRGSPYSLAPLVAYVLARDDEARALVTVAEARVQRLDAAGVRGAIDTVM